MREVFDDLARDDMDALLSNWADDGVYFNPTVGPPARGKSSVRDTITTMSSGLQARGETLIVDRVDTIGEGHSTRLYAQWHAEGGAKPGRLGLHVVSFNEAGLLQRVTVFAHNESFEV